MPFISNPTVISDSAQIAPSTIIESDIADKAISIAKLKDGTDGELITWNSSGVAAAVAVGTATQVLTSNGAGAAPTFQTPAAAPVYNAIVATRALSGSSGAVTYAHGLGVTPKYIRVTAVCETTATSATPARSTGSFNGTNTACVFIWQNGPAETGTLGTSSSNIVDITGEVPTRTQKATAAFDGTNITLTWTLGGTGATDTIHLLIEAMG